MKKKFTAHDDLDEVMRNAYGRRFIWRLLDECGIFNDPYVRGDPVETARQCGARGWAMGIFRELQANHFDLYQIMIREIHNEDEDEKKALDSSKENE